MCRLFCSMFYVILSKTYWQFPPRSSILGVWLIDGSTDLEVCFCVWAFTLLLLFWFVKFKFNLILNGQPSCIELLCEQLLSRSSLLLDSFCRYRFRLELTRALLFNGVSLRAGEPLRMYLKLFLFLFFVDCTAWDCLLPLCTIYYYESVFPRFLKYSLRENL